MTMLSDKAVAKLKVMAANLVTVAEACGANVDDLDPIHSLPVCVEDALIEAAELGMRDVLEAK